MVASAQGEDRSNHNPVTGWNGLQFGFVKATEGTGFTDPVFARNWANLKTAGIPRGAYHFFHPEADPVVQASFFVSTVKNAGLQPTDMLVCDSETDHAGVDDATLKFLNAVTAMLAYPQRHPRMVYTNHDVGQHLVKTAAAYPDVWFAHPSQTAPDPTLLAPWTTWRFWQWGQVNGVDKDAFNGTAGDLTTWLEQYKPQPVTTVVSWSPLLPTTMAYAARKHGTTPAAMVKAYQASDAYANGYRYGPRMRAIIDGQEWTKHIPLLSPAPHRVKLFNFKTVG